MIMATQPSHSNTGLFNLVKCGSKYQTIPVFKWLNQSDRQMVWYSSHGLKTCIQTQSWAGNQLSCIQITI